MAILKSAQTYALVTARTVFQVHCYRLAFSLFSLTILFKEWEKVKSTPELQKIRPWSLDDIKTSVVQWSSTKLEAVKRHRTDLLTRKSAGKPLDFPLIPKFRISKQII